MPDTPLENLPWPTPTDLTTFFTSIGLTVPAGIDLQNALDTAVNDLQDMSGYSPFMSSGTPQTRTFDGQYSNLITFGGGLLSPAGDGSDIQVTINGSVYANNFYAFKPNNAPQIGKPYTSIKFGRLQDGWLPVVNGPSEDGITYLGGAQRVIGITGQWGYCLPTAVPAKARRAVLHRAAAIVAPQIALTISKGLYLWHDGDESERYGGAGDSGPLSREAALWQSDFEAAARSFKRLSI